MENCSEIHHTDYENEGSSSSSLSQGQFEEGHLYMMAIYGIYISHKNILKVVSDLTESNILTFTLSDFVLLIRDPSVTG